jgi:23S rRNA (adenine2503-C2)-methyltransferase
LELGMHGRKSVNIEYLLLKGVNDSKAHADELNKYASQIPFFVNIIPFNPYPGAIYERPSYKDVETFKSYLVEHKIRTMVRTTRGDDILAACGQLANKV